MTTTACPDDYRHLDAARHSARRTAGGNLRTRDRERRRASRLAVNFVEAALVIDGSRDPIASRRFDDLLREAQVVIESVTEIQPRLARDVILAKAADTRQG